jgi:RNA-directed DNA polymerase
LPEKATTEKRQEVELPPAYRENADGLPEKVFLLRQKLYRKAKQEPKFKFYTMYGLIFRRDVLEAAWRRVAANRGSPGVDGLTILEVRNLPGGVEAFLSSIAEDLKAKTYRPQAVRRVHVPKPDGRLRPLGPAHSAGPTSGANAPGIPTVRDRVVQTAAKLVLEPIFEADFLDCSWGFRPKRSAHEALAEVRRNIKSGREAVYDADLSSYFDSIPHEKLLKCVRMRVTDRSVIKLLRMWLEAPVVEPSDGDEPPKVNRPKSGTPPEGQVPQSGSGRSWQGGVISPLLANLYLHWFDVKFHGLNGPYRWANARLVRYADDLVILARYVGRRIAAFVEDTLEEWMGLTLNRRKTRVVKLADPQASVDFLGYTFRYDRDLKGRPWQYLNVEPSKQALAKARDRVRELTAPRFGYLPIPALIGRLNRYLLGWQNYFEWGYSRKAMRAINRFVRESLYRHLRRRSQRPYRLANDTTWHAELERLGLVTL